MEGMLTGLRHRLERSLHRVEEQHQLLREVADQLDRAVASGAHADIERWLTRFVEALRSHFDLEETVVFPALHGLSESVRQDLEQLERDHGVFLMRVHGMLQGEASGGAQTLIDALGALRERLQSHERIEEGLIQRALSVSTRS